jgi:hypothetical protein
MGIESFKQLIIESKYFTLPTKSDRCLGHTCYLGTFSKSRSFLVVNEAEQEQVFPNTRYTAVGTILGLRLFAAQGARMIRFKGRFQWISIEDELFVWHSTTLWHIITMCLVDDITMFRTSGR